MKGPRSNAVGFTLLELLVAMTVLGVLTGLLATGLSFGTRVWEREQQQLEQWAELQTVQDVIRRTLGQAWPLTVASASGTPDLGFLGDSTSIGFFGPPPAQSLAGGVYRYGLIRRPGPGGVSLVLTWGLRTPDGAQRKGKRGKAAFMRRDDSLDDKQIILVDRLANAEFSYFGSDEEGVKPSWRDRWQNAAKLPLLVRMHVEFPTGDRRRWPDLIVAPVITGSPSEG